MLVFERKEGNMNLNYHIGLPGSGYDNRFHQTVAMTKEADLLESQVVNIYPELSYETFEGFGGAVTEAAAYVYSLMSEEDRKRVIETYFAPDQMHYRFVRVPIDSCDFGLGPFEAVSDPADTDLQSFSFARMEKYILPMLEDIRKAAGEDLHLLLSPWSPPAFMKTNGKRQQGGHLKREYYRRWAEYLCRYIEAFQERGFAVQRITVQNESNAVQAWDSCLYSAEEEKTFIKEALYPALLAHGLDDVEIFIWDHNKERVYERVRDTIDPETEKMIQGVAFHWYSGDHFEGLELVRQRYPHLKLILSESCLEYRLYDGQNLDDLRVRLCHEILGDLAHGMCAFYDWNLLLDEKGGPNYVGNYCHAPFLYDTKRKILLPQKTLQTYWQLAHYLVPGSVRLATTTYTDKIDAVSFRTPEEKIVLFVLNKSDDLLPVNVRVGGLGGSLLLPGKMLAACEIGE